MATSMTLFVTTTESNIEVCQRRFSSPMTPRYSGDTPERCGPAVPPIWHRSLLAITVSWQAADGTMPKFPNQLRITEGTLVV